ncbi:hypothetical protein KKC1_00170 [Calderihabitans maritimus]|uniref:Uncharacterized protein n=1 Tax=Calderihabitans maritimus TaxID=1246530 RepID=A0A1Z5HNH5_9FIRM|nr:hypothetical protein KKC1_00170 [Calderihabitans maritimus]
MGGFYFGPRVVFALFLILILLLFDGFGGGFWSAEK